MTSHNYEGGTHLLCPTCDLTSPLGLIGPCPSCGGILECVYPAEALRCLREPLGERGLSRYLPLLPVTQALPSLGEGDTPLLRSNNLAEVVGLSNLFLKNETVNPTGSFKDRGAVIAVGRALADGMRGLLTASTGNAAAALSAYCASQRLRCMVLFSQGSPLGKLRQALAYGAHHIQVKNLFGGKPETFNQLLMGLSERLDLDLAFFWAPTNPYLLEGMKTIAYEIVAQIGGWVPDVVICPVGGGDGLAGQWRGYQELHRAGVIHRLPRMIGVQPSGAAPLVASFQQGADRVLPIEEAHTVASGLQSTFSGDHALRAIRASGGTAIAVEDSQILGFQRLLARLEGVWVEPSGTVSVAALATLVEADLIQPEERVVCILTGAGFKDQHHDGVGATAGDAPDVEVPAAEFDLEEIEAQAQALLSTEGWQGRP
jgi:threonine synthase